jgi:hypothetical protein
MALLDKILGAMTDDKGLFRGGKYGRVLGGTKDMLGIKPGQRALERDYKVTTHERERPYVGDQGPQQVAKKDRFSQVGNRLNYLVANFDPSSNKSVMDLQKALNANGFNLEEDGMFGKKTLDAVRSVQNARENINESYGDERVPIESLKYDPVTEEIELQRGGNSKLLKNVAKGVASLAGFGATPVKTLEKAFNASTNNREAPFNYKKELGY